MPATEKACTKCGIVKPLEAFHKHKGFKATGRLSQCRVCRNAVVAEYRRRVGWKVRGMENPAARAERTRRYQAQRRGQRCSCCTKADLVPIYEFARVAGLEVDHIKALSRGGLHCQRNLQLLTPTLNRRKYNF